MFADGVGTGAEQTVDRMLFVLLLLVHHGAVLTASETMILGSHTVTVFRDMSGGCQKITMAILAKAWAMTMLKTVLEIKYIKVNEALADYLLHRNPLLFVVGILKIGKTRNQTGKGKEFLHFAKRHTVRYVQKVVVQIEAGVRCFCKLTLCPPL